MTKTELKKKLFQSQFKARSKQLIKESEERLAKLEELLNNLNKELKDAN